MGMAGMGTGESVSLEGVVYQPASASERTMAWKVWPLQQTLLSVQKLPKLQQREEQD